MSALNSLFIKKETLQEILNVINAKELKGVELTISINDEVNPYGQNVSAYVSQSKEDREVKKNKYYVGSGKTFWTDGKISVVSKQPENAVMILTDSDESLPF